MIRLMKNELKKLLKKKSFYIVTFIFILFCILTNVIYKTGLNYVIDSEGDISELEQENEDLDLTSDEDLLIYVENLTMIEKEHLKKEYSSNIANYLIDNYLTTTIYNMYEAEYILEDLSLYQEYYNELQNDLKLVSDNNWEYFLNERISYLKERCNVTTGIENTRYNRLLELAQYRSDNHIPYDTDNYLHNSLAFIEENTFEYINLLNDDAKTKEEEERLDYLEEQMSIHEYVLENEEDILNESNLRSVLINFSQEFGIFILIYVIMMAGSIVSEEYSRGTIKYLLTKPFRRSTILTSKLLVVLLLIPGIMIFMSLIEILIGGIILGFSSLSVPVVLFSDGAITTYSVIGYLVSEFLSIIPMYLVIGLLAFMISTITASTSAAITVSFLFYLLGNVISNLALVYNLPIFKTCVSLYWDFSYLITNSTQPYNASFLTSILVIILYIMVMLFVSYFIFSKKDVKNI